MANTYEQQARERKVFALVEFLAKAGITADDAERAIDDTKHWTAAAAAHLKINPPSRETRRQVVAALREKEKVSAG